MSDTPRDAADSLAAEVSQRLRDRYEQASFGGDEAALAEGLAEVAVLRGLADLAQGRQLAQACGARNVLRWIDADMGS